jgi:MFS family permease
VIALLTISAISTIIAPMLQPTVHADRAVRAPYVTCLLVGLGGLFYGVTGPLLSTFVPILVRDALGDHRTLIGMVMAIDNVLLLLLVPWAGVISDRAAGRGGSRLPLVLLGFGLASAGMALFPVSVRLGIAGVIAAIVVLYSGINTVRSPFQALVADLVPSRYRSLATGSVTFQMCAGAIVFLVLGRTAGMQIAFLIGAVTVLGIALAFVSGIHERARAASGTEATFRSLIDAVSSIVRGAIPGLRSMFIATLLLQMVFQSFTTWFALHGTERFRVGPGDVTIGFIAWALGGVIGSLPAGFIGVRIGRRNAILLGFAVMGVCLIALDRVSGARALILLIALTSAAWTLPSVNAYPLFIEQVPRQRRGVLAAMYLLSMALGGAIGDPLNGTLFDLAHSYRPLFLIMTGYSALAIVAMALVPRGAGEADTGPDAAAAVAVHA